MIVSILKWTYILIVLFYVGLIIYDFYYQYPTIQKLTQFNEVIVKYKDNTTQKFKTLNSVTNKENVVHINCSNMNLHTLEGIDSFTGLTELDCSGNFLINLVSLDNIKILPSCLIKLNCSNNHLYSLYGIENCTNIQSIDCSRNYISFLSGLNNCKELINIKCDTNRISTLNGIDKCIRLKTLHANDNYISYLPSFIIELKELNDINIEGNPIELGDVLTGDNLLNFIDSINKNKINKVKVYNDNQNTHNSTITKAIKSSIEALLKEDSIDLDSLKI